MSADSSDHHPPEHRPDNKFGSPLRVIATVLLAFISSQLIAVILLSIGMGVLQLGGSTEDLLTGSAAAQFAYVFTAETLAVGIIYLFLRRRHLGFSAIGFGRGPSWRDGKWALAGFGLFYVLLIITTIIISELIPSFDVDQAQDVGFKSLNNSLDRLIAFAALVILPPLGEEILMRGYLYSGLRASMRFLPAMLITSVLFGLAHLEYGRAASLVWVAGVSTFILSIVLVYTREKTGALYTPIAIHGMNNSVAFAIHFL